MDGNATCGAIGEETFDCYPNETLEDCILVAKGPKRGDLVETAIITVVYMLIFLTGFLGNVATCIVIFKNKYMHTATNFYLFNLAIADLLWLTLGSVYEIPTLWQRYPYIYGAAFCTGRFLAAEACTFVSVWTMMMFTVERYIAICHPMRINFLSRLGRVIRFLVVIWIASVFLSIPQTYSIGLSRTYLVKNVTNLLAVITECHITRAPEAYKISITVTTLIFGVLPLTAVAILYCLIGLRLRKTLTTFTSRERRSSCSTEKDLRARMTVIKMSVAIVVTSVICWVPFHIQRIFACYEISTEYDEELFIFSGVFYYLNASINPIIYSVVCAKFRQAFKAMFLGTFCSKYKVKRLSISSGTQHMEIN